MLATRDAVSITLPPRSRTAYARIIARPTASTAAANDNEMLLPAKPRNSVVNDSSKRTIALRSRTKAGSAKPIDTGRAQTTAASMARQPFSR